MGMRVHVWSLNSNWKRLLVILAPLWPEKTNILSRHTAAGKLQQEGGISPLWATSSQHVSSRSWRPMVHMSFNLALPS